MPENTPEAPPVPPAFRRRRVTRTAAAIASSGLVVGLGSVAATPAIAATTDDCDTGNTVTAPGDDAADIQVLLDADTAIVCLAGAFTLSTPLTFDHDLTLFGLAGAQLDGDNATQILVGSLGADLLLQNLAFLNGSGADGGAVYVDGDLEVENSRFDGNDASDDGGAIYYDGSNIVAILDSTFTNNSADDFGGAIYGENIITEGSTFTGNSAFFGGAMYASGSAQFESTFVGNDAFLGGAIATDEYSASLGSTFAENSAEDGGAVSSYGLAYVLNSTFVENTASDVGGAIVTGYAQIGLSTFLDNEANTSEAGERGDAVIVYDDRGGSSVVVGNIFAGSRSLPQLGAVEGGSWEDRGGNVFSTAEATEVAIDTPAPSTLFGQSVEQIFGAGASLAGNGGSTETVILIPGSPAVDVVPDSGFLDVTSAEVASAFAAVDGAYLSPAADTVDEDQRGEPRDGLRDAGAVELQADELGSELAATGAPSTAANWGWLGAAFVALGSLVLLARGRRSTV